MPTSTTLTLGQLEVGTSVYINENNIPQEYIVVHQGNPNSTIYTNVPTNSTWVMRKQVLNSNYNILDSNTQGPDLNGTSLSLTTNTISLLHSVALPTGSGVYTTTDKYHLLNVQEVDNTQSGQGTNGNILTYFTTDAQNRRIAYDSTGVAQSYWLRGKITSSYTDSQDNTITEIGQYYIATDGTVNYTTSTYLPSRYCRPLLIFDSNTSITHDYIIN